MESPRVPFLDLGAPHRDVDHEMAVALARVVRSNRFVLGQEVEEFEFAWARYCEAAYAVGVGNGLDALQLILRALGVGFGDEVLVPEHTFIASWLAVTLVGATPVPVAVDPETLNMNPGRVEAAISPRTRAIIAVHLYGQPADLDALAAVALANDVLLIEDAAQAHGARYKGNRIGGHSTAAAWSFYPGKNLGALGDAGAITTNDSTLAERIRLLRNYGSRQKYEHEILGVNSRLDEIQAAVLKVKLGHLDRWNLLRAKIAETYLNGLRPLLNDKPKRGQPRLLALPHVPHWADPVWHLFVVRVLNRTAVRAALAERGIETSIHYPLSPGEQLAYAEGLPKSRLDLGGAELGSQLLSLPIGPHISLEDAELVIGALRDVFL